MWHVWRAEEKNRDLVGKPELWRAFACGGEKNANRFLVSKPDGKVPLRRHRCRRIILKCALNK